MSENISNQSFRWLSIPISIVLAAGILGVSYYFVQIEKQESIERQQRIELESEQDKWEAQNERDTIELKQQECEALAEGVMDRWYNVLGVTYDADLWEECVVTYTDTDTGEVETSPLRFMQDN